MIDGVVIAGQRSPSLLNWIPGNMRAFGVFLDVNPL